MNGRMGWMDRLGGMYGMDNRSMDGYIGWVGCMGYIDGRMGWVDGWDEQIELVGWVGYVDGFDGCKDRQTDR